MNEFQAKMLSKTGYHIIHLRDSYEEYLEKAEVLLDRVNDGIISTEQYIWDIQLLMNQYHDCIIKRRKELRKSA